MNDRARARLILQLYVLGIPLWWVSGLDFIVLQGFTVVLVLTCPHAMARHTLGDYFLLALIVTLLFSAYVNGFLIEREVTRFAAALYNLSFWVAGLILIQQVRMIFAGDRGTWIAFLRAGHLGFLILAGTGWGCFVLAYAIGDLSLIAPSLFGLLVGERIPDSAPHIQRHAWLVFTLADWGLPGVPMPRVRVFGPYPTATAATAAVLGSLSLLYLNARNGGRGSVLSTAIEAAILITVALTLTRSILGGWVMGALTANLLFGSTMRRIGAAVIGAGLGGMMALGLLDLSQAAEYREYSSESRFESYQNAITRTLETNPLLGLGIKPREESHIAVGSHSTFVSSFTKGGLIGLTLATLFLLVRPGWRWLMTWVHVTVRPGPPGAEHLANLRILFNLQVALWVWLAFEDVDAPATAAAMIFIAYAVMEHMTAAPRRAAFLAAPRSPGHTQPLEQST